MLLGFAPLDARELWFQYLVAVVAFDCHVDTKVPRRERLGRLGGSVVPA